MSPSIVALNVPLGSSCRLLESGVGCMGLWLVAAAGILGGVWLPPIDIQSVKLLLYPSR